MKSKKVRTEISSCKMVKKREKEKRVSKTRFFQPQLKMKRWISRPLAIHRRWSQPNSTGDSYRRAFRQLEKWHPLSGRRGGPVRWIAEKWCTGTAAATVRPAPTTTPNECIIDVDAWWATYSFRSLLLMTNGHSVWITTRSSRCLLQTSIRIEWGGLLSHHANITQKQDFPWYWIS